MDILDQYCRICAHIDEELKFSISTVSQISQETIEDMLIYCTQLKVTPYDGLPQQVCAACMNSLNAAFFFRKLCYKSDATLKELRRGTAVEHRQLATPTPPPATELVVLLEKIPITAAAELVLKDENIDQDELYEPELDFDDSYLDEDYTPGDDGDGDDGIEQTSSAKESEAVQKPTYVCRSISYCSFVTTNHRKMEDHVAKRGHPTFETKSVLNGPDDSLLYACKYETLCEYKTANKNNFERHGKKLNHADYVKIGDNTKRPKLFKCKECVFEHNKQNEFNKHQLQSTHRLYSVQDQPSYVCPNCNSERKNYGFLIKHMVSCTGIQDLEEVKRLADGSLASQSANETIKTEVELFDLVAPIEDYEEVSASQLGNTADTTDKPARAKIRRKSTTSRRQNTDKSTTTNLYVCRHKHYCDFETDTLNRLEQHQEVSKHPLTEDEPQTNSDSFACKGYTFCKYQTTHKFNFVRHQTGAKHTGFKLLENQTSRKVYKCQECVFQRNKRATFKQHQSEFNHALFTAAFELFFSCPNCDRQFSKYSVLSEHMGSCTEKLNPPPEASADESDASDYTETSRKERRRKSTATPNFSRESSPELDTLTISETNRNKNSWVVRCDFCNYGCNRDKVSNIQRHVANKCRLWQYQDENQDIFADNSPRNVYNTLDEISTLTSSSGKRLLPLDYAPELFDSTTTSRPPMKLVTSVLRYGWWLVLTVRGVRCCGCSMFFEDMDSLQKHRDEEHPTVRLSASKQRPHCEQCFRVFVNQESFDYHLQLQDSAKLIYCITCAKLLISNTAWVTHCGLHHVSAPHVQPEPAHDEVDGENRNSIEIKQEPIEPVPSKRARGEKRSRLLERYRCPRCAFRCAKLVSLRTHLVKHDAVTRFACRICNVSYGTQLDLQQHKRRTHDFKQEAL